MENYFEILKKKICDNIDIEKIEVIDNTYLHKNHKGFQKSKYHLKLIIKSDSLRKLPKVKAHQNIMNLLKTEFDTKIHALEISII